MEAEAFVDIQGVNYSLCDPEIASSTLMARDDTILFSSEISQQQRSRRFLANTHATNTVCYLNWIKNRIHTLSGSRRG